MPVPQYSPTPRELDDLELLLAGAFAPAAEFTAEGPFTLDLPSPVADDVRAAGALELVDPEGLPLALVDPAAVEEAESGPSGTVRLTGPVVALAHPAYGPFRRLYLTPVQVREAWPEALTVPVTAPLSASDLTEIEEHAQGRPVLLLALGGVGTPVGVTPVGLLRATVAAARLLPGAHVAAVPLAARAADAGGSEQSVRSAVVGAYSTGEVLTPSGSGALPAEVAAVVADDQPEAAERGAVVFFTGLSGSGKSTLARALHDLLLEQGGRTVTSLDGDVVRRNLSAGLTFSREDRETNIRRIGWVAAEIGRHRGIAICSPIAPFDATRKQVRAMVEEAGATFVLVHVATPLEECERRDRKGLYARARRGEIPEFTGISSPYEEPADADLRVDTTARSVKEALSDVLCALRPQLEPTGVSTSLLTRG